MRAFSFWVVIGAVLLPAILYFIQAWREEKNISDIADFFPLRRRISSGEYRSTTLAAGMSLATVIIAFVNLAPMLGITLFVSVLSFAFSFLVLYPCVGRIMDSNPRNDTIQTFLGKAYDSIHVRYIALFFSLIGYISIFSMELLVGVTVLEPFLGDNVLVFALLYLVFIIVYSLMSGYRAIIATDKWQLRFIIASIVAILLFAVSQLHTAEGEISNAQIFGKITGSWVTSWPFIIGIIIMNLPAPISDAGTWQRLCSTRDKKTAKKGLLQVVPLFAVLWAAFVLIGCYYNQIAITSYGFDPTKGSLVASIMTSLGSGDWWYMLLLFVFTLGLFSAMISTADSLLIVAGQILSIDILGLQPKRANVANTMKKARIAVAAIALLSFTIFTIFKLIDFNVVQLVFAIYGAQLAMFPAVFAALFLRSRIDLTGARWAAMLSVLAGFVGGWGSAIYGKMSGNANWLYNAPVTALTTSALIFILFAVIIKGRNSVKTH